MQNRREFTAAFRQIFRKGNNHQEKELFARWFTRLDLSDGKIFSDQAEEAEIEKRMERNLHDHFLKGFHKTKTFHFQSWMSVAAAALLIIVAGALFYMPRLKNEKQTAYQEFFTHTGERKIITLSDGSVITLSNSSRIKVPSGFSGNFREVYLDGEAFFEVTHNPQQPFIVRTTKLKVQVLGTSFDVRQYRSDQTLSVTVVTGKVGVNVKDNRLTWMLTPGRQFAYNSSNGKAIENIVNPSDYTSWQKGILIFNNEKLEDICKRLERWYGVSITIKNEAISGKRISMKQDNENLETVLSMLGKAGGYKFKIQDKNVQIW